jgi:hypothetical protein
VDVTDLRVRANRELADLGPEPDDPHDHALWVEERRGAVILLAELADNDSQLLRDAATGEWVHLAHETSSSTRRRSARRRESGADPKADPRCADV